MKVTNFGKINHQRIFLCLRSVAKPEVLELTTWLRIMGKELCFHKTGPIMMPKSTGYKIFTVFLICMCKRQDDKTGTADLMKCASKMHFRTRRVRYTSRRQVLD